MSTTTQTRRERRMKTWSRLGNLGRVPTEYEIVTHGMVHTKKDTPLEMGEETFSNQWFKRYRDNSGLVVKDWDAFRDPNGMFYRLYCQQRDDSESYIDKAIEEYTVKADADVNLDSATIEFLAQSFTPTRYLAHGYQMLSGYVQQLASTSYVANAASFQTADQLRRVQRIAYRTKQLANAHPDAGFGSGERSVWENSAAWQPARRAIEELFVNYAWHEMFVGFNLLVKPVLDGVTLDKFAEVAREAGDSLDAILSNNLYKDSQQSLQWSCALASFLVEEDSANKKLLAEAAQKYRKKAEAAGQAYGGMLARQSGQLSEQEIGDYVTGRIDAVLADAGLS